MRRPRRLGWFPSGLITPHEASASFAWDPQGAQGLRPIDGDLGLDFESRDSEMGLSLALGSSAIRGADHASACPDRTPSPLTKQ
jgi:hypothetical protein